MSRSYSLTFTMHYEYDYVLCTSFELKKTLVSYSSVQFCSNAIMEAETYQMYK